jgi:predicted metal-dependent enzyme (double-stranded beta helix superfamily)
MCDLHDVLHGDTAAGNEDEFILDTARVRAFIHETREAIAHTSSAVEACVRIEPSFTSLLADEDWLPSEYQQDAPESGMGGGIGQWLLFRSHDRSLCLFSLVVPPGAMTPIHDHLAWGIIGLYRGNQDEEFYHPGNGHPPPSDRRRSPRADDVGADLRLDPLACQRYGVHRAPQLRRDHG